MSDRAVVGCAMHCIVYKSGYKYQLKRDFTLEIPIRPVALIGNDFVKLDDRGVLVIKSAYAWDGPSGPTIDTQNFMRGSLVHDALYQLMREGWLEASTWRQPADRLLQQLCIEDGMSSLRAWWVYQGVRFGGGPATDPASDKPLQHAPKGCTDA